MLCVCVYILQFLFLQISSYFSLQSKIRSLLEEAVISPFYLDKIKDDQGTRVPSVLSMSILY